MSDTEVAGKGDGIPPQDANFILCCLKNTVGGVVAVDPAKVALELGYSNPRSVTNKISAIKKKYSIPISSAGAKSGAAVTSTADFATALATAKTTTTPTKAAKGKVLARKTATPRKTPNKKAPKSAVKAADADGEEEADAEMEDTPEEA
ncbi:hypothetical protein VTL71DRAFT_2735 [Oculimacula yallundae]|uniref:Uncharacterized protein n=1 Tax=Oculimacula yallundae TaxID=86028 RepID=A0ABR4C9P8_9HELO